jgi:hypothetical protein
MGAVLLSLPEVPRCTIWCSRCSDLDFFKFFGGLNDDMVGVLWCMDGLDFMHYIPLVHSKDSDLGKENANFLVIVAN